MNHFAHLVLAQPTVESTVGNLLGDFARGVEIDRLPAPVRAGLMNHRAVDRFTDAHPSVLELKRLFGRRRRRFAGIALDIYFDHLLIRHWQRFERRDLDALIDDFYRRMASGAALMPNERMRGATRRMIEHDWFGSYRDEEAVAAAMDRVAARIRFDNDFGGAIDELRPHRERIAVAFAEFYPALRAHIASLDLENAADPG